METILQWFSSNQMIAWIGSLIIGIPAVWSIAVKFSPKIKKALKITEKLTALINGFLRITEDKKITKEEVEEMALLINELQAVLK